MDKQLHPFIALISMSLVAVVIIVVTHLVYANELQADNAITPLPDCEFLFQYEEWTVVRCRERQ